MNMSLAELKAQNKAEEEKQAQENTDAPKQETDETLGDDTKPEIDPVKDEPKGDLDEDLNNDEGGESELESWMKPDDEEVDGDGKKFTDGDVAAVRRKFKGKLHAEQEKNSGLEEEISRLREENARLSGGGQSQQQAPGQVERKPMPMESDFGYDREQYSSAMKEWIRQEHSVLNQEHSKESAATAQMTEAAAKTEKAVGEHYQRVDALVKEAGISDDAYEQADLTFRKVVDDVSPGNGDSIADGIIARLGKGSEKVVFSVGVNKTKRATFQRKLQEDPSGLSAAMYLGELNKEFQGAGKKSSNAPAPGARLEGDAGGSENASKLQRQYEKETDLQARISLKRKAKQQGINVDGWR